MAIVRELLVRLGFQTDRKGINQANQAISSFRTKFAFIAAGATYAFSRISSFFTDVSRAALSADDLARSLGISLRDLTKIQGAAQQAGRIDFEQTAQALGRVQDLLTGFLSGTDETLSRIANSPAFSFEIDRESVTNNFDFILKGLANIQDESRRIQIAKNIFGKDIGVAVSRLAKNFDNFKSSIPDFEQLGVDAQNAIPELEKYQRAINNLSTAWMGLANSLTTTVIPALTKVTEYLTSAVEIYSGLFSGDDSLLAKGLKKGSQLLDPLFQATGLDKVSNFFKDFRENNRAAEYWKATMDYIENRPGYQSPGMIARGQAPLVMNTEFNINIPSGNTEEMKSYLSEDVNEAFMRLQRQYFENIKNNNPVIE